MSKYCHWWHCVQWSWCGRGHSVTEHSAFMCGTSLVRGKVMTVYVTSKGLLWAWQNCLIDHIGVTLSFSHSIHMKIVLKCACLVFSIAKIFGSQLVNVKNKKHANIRYCKCKSECSIWTISSVDVVMRLLLLSPESFERLDKCKDDNDGYRLACFM